MGKKTEGESADSRCVDRKVKGEGQEILVHRPHGERDWGACVDTRF